MTVGLYLFVIRQPVHQDAGQSLLDSHFDFSLISTRYRVGVPKAAIIAFALGAVRAVGAVRAPSLMNRVGTVALRCTPLVGLPPSHRAYQGRESLAIAIRSQSFSAA